MSVNREEIAVFFANGMNCTQIVLSHFCENYQMSKKEAVRIGCGFGGGARQGELCGAVSGAVMVIGLKYGKDSDDSSENKRICYQKTCEFHDRFRKKNGSIVCRDLLGCDMSTADGWAKAQKENRFQTICVDLVVSAIQILEELGY